MIEIKAGLALEGRGLGAGIDWESIRELSRVKEIYLDRSVGYMGLFSYYNFSNCTLKICSFLCVNLLQF